MAAALELSLLRPHEKVNVRAFHVDIVFASACVSMLAVWKRCCRLRLASPRNDGVYDGQKDLNQRGRIDDLRRTDAAAGGGDLDGVAVGSTLVPLLLSASSSLTQYLRNRDTSLSGNARDGSVGNNTSGMSALPVDVYAQMVAMLGLAFAIAALLGTTNCIERFRYQHSYTLTVWFHENAVRENSIIILTALIFSLLSCLLILKEYYFPVSGNFYGQTFIAIKLLPYLCFVEVLLLICYCLPSSEITEGRRRENPVESSIDMVFVNSKSETKSTKKSTASGNRIETKPAILSGIFTIGEWIVISPILSIAIVDFWFRYCQITGRILPPLLPHLAVSHGGTIGCLLGCGASSLMKNHGPLAVFSTKICLVVASTVACVEIALGHSCSYFEGMCGALTVQASPQVSTNFAKFMPSSLIWLQSYLLELEQPLCSSMGRVDTEARPRWIWLVYWAICLISFAPPAIYYAGRHKQRKNGDTGNKVDSGRMRDNVKYVVVARKYFHFVAIFLFLPPTYFAPSMMALSYAVAFALLILVEALRTTRPNVHSIVCQENETRSINCSLSINDFYEAFFDEKDIGGMKGGLVITHSALIFGCALPLWFYEIMFRPSAATLQIDPPFFANNEIMQEISGIQVMPLIGILSLGIGDAAGAIAGSFIGRTQWPGSQRTVEGSTAMLLSMGFSLYLCPLFSWHSFGFIGSGTILVLTTFMEAFTAQIDNICLPIGGINIVLLLLLFKI